MTAPSTVKAMRQKRYPVSVKATSKKRIAARPMPLRHLLESPVSTVHVGPQSTPFLIHKELLDSVTRLFSSALNPSYSFKESTSGVVLLDETEPDTFAYFAQWLYSGSLEHEQLDVSTPAYFQLIKLGSLADYIGVEKCMNDIMDEVFRLADKTNTVPTAEDTRSIWKDEEPSTTQEPKKVAKGLKGVVIDLFVWKRTEVLMRSHEDSWDERFMRDLVVRLKEIDKNMKAPWKDPTTRCKEYHIHLETEKCVQGSDGVDNKVATATVQPDVSPAGSEDYWPNN